MMELERIREEHRRVVEEKKKMEEELEKMRNEKRLMEERKKKQTERRKMRAKESNEGKEQSLKEKEERMKAKRLEKENAKRVEKEEKERKREEKERQLKERLESKRLEMDKKRTEKLELERKRVEREEKEKEKLEAKRRKVEACVEQKQKEAARFISYFCRSDKSPPPKFESSVASGSFRPFQLKKLMTVAPILRRVPISKDVYDHLFTAPIEVPYLSHCRDSAKTRQKSAVRLMRAKLFQFHDCYRPPYYGTWRSRSSVITGRTPFAKDTEKLNYEVMSEDEWEEDVEGEDIDDEASNEDGAELEERCSDDDDGYFVEHGYLSGDEGDKQVLDEPDEQRKARLHAKAEEWETGVENRKKGKEMRPRFYGPVFTSGELPENAPPWLFKTVIMKSLLTA